MQRVSGDRTDRGWLLAVGLAVLTAGCQAEARRAAAPPPRVVDVGEVRLRMIATPVRATGLLAPREELAVFPEVSGYRVARLLADENDHVRAGAPLAVLDDTLLRGELAQARAHLAEQRAALELATRDADRAERLRPTGVLSAAQIDQKQLVFEGARAAVAAQEAHVQDLLVREGKLVLRAPADGLVLERSVRVGDIANAGATTPFFRIARAGVIELRAEIPEPELKTVRPGQAVQVTLPGGDHVVGRVRRLSPRIDDRTKLGLAYVDLPLGADGARAGGFARADLQGPMRSALTAPAAALRYNAGGSTLMVLDPGLRVRETPVRTGEHLGGEVELLQGPAAGVRVVVSSAAFVLPGERVRLAAADSAAPAAGRRP